MIYKTHILFAESVVFSPVIFEKLNIISADVNFWNNYSIIEIYIFMFIVAISALLPDLDEEEAWLSKKIPFVSYFTGKLAHRGLTHYFITPTILFLILFFTVSQDNMILVYLIIAGWVLHILGDSMTKSGIPKAFFPLKFGFYMFPKAFRFKTFGVIERHIVLPLFFFIYCYEVFLILSANNYNFGF